MTLPSRISIAKDNNFSKIQKAILERQPFILQIQELKDFKATFDLILNRLKTCSNQELLEIESIKNLDSNENSESKMKTRIKMTFQEFLKSITENDNNIPGRNLYLNTQYANQEQEYLDKDEELLKTIFTPPLFSMFKDEKELPFNLSLPFMGNLILQQVNIWMGAATETGTSSGLHHDFHDNCYFLLQGRKKFTLFPPSDFPNLYLHGVVSTLYPNGMFAYSPNQGKDAVRADGSFGLDAAEYRLEKASLSLEEAQENGADIEKELQELDEAMQGVMEFETSLDQVNLESFEQESIKKSPPSFSKIPCSVLEQDATPEMKDEYPLLSSTNRFDFELQSGEMLFLPCGWFHRVVSLNDLEAKDKYKDVHFALNYWFAPPTTMDLNCPYRDTFWKETFFDQMVMALERIGKNIS